MQALATADNNKVDGPRISQLANGTMNRQGRRGFACDAMDPNPLLEVRPRGVSTGDQMRLVAAACETTRQIPHFAGNRRTRCRRELRRRHAERELPTPTVQPTKRAQR